MDIMRDLTEHEQLTLYALTTLAAGTLPRPIADRLPAL